MATKTTATVNQIGVGEVEVSIVSLLRAAQFSPSNQLVRVGGITYDVTPSEGTTLNMTGGKTILFKDAFRSIRRKGYGNGIFRKEDGSSQLVDLSSASITYVP